VRSILSILILLVALPTRLSATSIVAIWNSNDLVLGADSKAIHVDRSLAKPACKIGIANQVVWSYSGLAAAPTENFNVDDTAKQAMSTNATFDDRIAEFESDVVVPLADALNHIKLDNPDWYIKHHEGTATLETIFSTIENGTVRLYATNFIIKIDHVLGTISVDISGNNCPSASCAGVHIFDLGEHEAIDREFSNDLLTKLGTNRTVQYLIETEIAAHPDDVGPPIAMIELDKGGMRWISKGDCGGD